MTLPKIFLKKLDLVDIGKVEYITAGSHSLISPTFEGLVQIPDLSSDGWLVEIDSDESNQDLIIGNKFLQAICLDLKLKFTLDYQKESIKFD